MAEDPALQAPEQMRPAFDAIVELTDRLCQEHLTDGYARSALA